LVHVENVKRNPMAFPTGNRNTRRSPSHLGNHGNEVWHTRQGVTHCDSREACDSHIVLYIQGEVDSLYNRGRNFFTAITNASD